MFRISSALTLFLFAHSFARYDSLYHLDSITIRAQHPQLIPNISVDNEEKMLGRTDDLNNILAAKPGVATAPNSQSLLLVNGDGPYDNVYMVRGVPVFAPSHFAGVPYLDRSVFSLGTPLDIAFLTTGISGLYCGGSGSVLQIDPGIIHDPLHISRPEVVADYGTLGADVSLSVPVYKDKDFFQISYRPADKYALWFLNEYKNINNNLPAGYTCPSSYTDLQILGSQNIGGVYIRQLLWFSQDTYADSTVVDPYSAAIPQEKKMPWGIVSVSLDSLKLPLCKSIVIGGASQHWFESRGGIAGFSKDVSRRNIALSATGPTFLMGQGIISIGIRTQYVPWTGLLIIPATVLPILSLKMDSLTIFGYQADFSAIQGYTQNAGNLLCGVNLCEGVFFPGPKGFVDPGLWMRYRCNNISFDVSCGIITSQPDIRGMPSRMLETKLVRTFNGNAKVQLKPLSWLNGSIEGFVKYKPFQPYKNLNPQYPVWDDSSDHRFIASGVNTKIEANVGKKIKVRTVQTFSRSIISKNEFHEPYEWDIPWTNKTIFAYSFIDSTLTAFAISNFSAGLPYHVVEVYSGGFVWSKPVNRYEPYSRIDLKFQFCEPIPYQRHLMQYDAYFLIADLGGFINNTNARSPDAANVLYHLHIGLRVHIRF